MSAKGGQKERFPGQRPKSRAKEGHDRAPSQKQGSLAAMFACTNIFACIVCFFIFHVSYSSLLVGAVGLSQYYASPVQCQ